MKLHPMHLTIAAAALGLVLATPPAAFAQRGFGQKARMDTITETFKLEKDQRKEIKAAIDAAFKDAAPIRAELDKARNALVDAIAAGKGQADIDAAAQAYGTQAAALADAEMKAFAQLIGMLNEEQSKNNAAISSTFFLLRGAFADDKKWDDIPDPMKGY